MGPKGVCKEGYKEGAGPLAKGKLEYQEQALPVLTPLNLPASSFYLSTYLPPLTYSAVL